MFDPQFAKDLGLQEFILEGGSLFVYCALAGLSHPSTMVALFVYGILDSCHEVRNVRFSHVQRKENKSAHLLAKHALVSIDFFYSLDGKKSLFLGISSSS